MNTVQSSASDSRIRWLLVGMFVLLVGLSFFARHYGGLAANANAYTALALNPDAFGGKQPEKFMWKPNNLLWDETAIYARYVQQILRGDWFGNTFQAYQASAADNAPAEPARYPFFFDRAGPFLVAALAQLTGDVARAFALADFLFPLLIALTGAVFCLQLRSSVAFAVWATALFVWFNYSDTVTWLRVLSDASVPDGMVFSRTPYPQVAVITFLLFGIAFLRAQRTPNFLYGFLLAAAIALNAWTYIYAWLLALAVTAMLPVVYLLNKPLALDLDRKFVLTCLGALGASFILSAPLWLAYVWSPQVARDVVSRFAAEPVALSDSVLVNGLLVAFVALLLLPPLRVMRSRAFWFAFWLGGLLAYNQNVITGVEVQPSHFTPYFFGTFAMIFLADLALAVWQGLFGASYRAWSNRVLIAFAVVFAVGGFAAITWRNLELARVQTAYNRTSANWNELVNALNQLPPDAVVLTTDDYLQNVLPAFVKRRFALPVFQDPLTNDEIARLQNASARVLGYPDWKMLQANKPPPKSLAPFADWAFDSDKVYVVVNRQRAGRNPTEFSKTIFTNQDFLVGVGPIR